MCTLILLRRPQNAWPVLIASNRDENLSRGFLPPDYHWPDYPDVIGGWDSVAKGSWFAVNGAGVFAGIMNRPGSLGPHQEKRSRGELVLESLTHADASAAAESLSQIDPKSYAPFNLVIADNQYACWLKNDGVKIQVQQIPEGYSMFTSRDRNDYDFARVRTYLPRFQSAKVPDPENNNWRDWESLLSSRMHSADTGIEGAMCLTGADYGTVCSQILALPHMESMGKKPVFLFANGRPGEAAFEKVEL